MRGFILGALALFLGLFIGSFFNFAVLLTGMLIFPLPEGMDPMVTEHWTEYGDQLEFTHFLPPLLAHAVGTLVGALVALLASGRKPFLAFLVGLFFLVGGIVAAMDIPAPAWFLPTDLVLAYVPMAWLATKILGPKEQ